MSSPISKERLAFESRKYNASPLVLIPGEGQWLIGTAFGQKRDFLACVPVGEVETFLARQYELHSRLAEQSRLQEAATRARREAALESVPEEDLRGLTIEDFQL